MNIIKVLSIKTLTLEVELMLSENNSEAWLRFIDSFFENPSREGPDWQVFDLMSQEERKKAEGLLLKELNSDTTYLIQALGYLKSDRAYEQIKYIFNRSSGLDKIYAAEALWRIANCQPALDYLLKIAKGTGFLPSNSNRIRAIIILGALRTQSVIDTLATVLYDNNALIKYHAFNSLAIVLDILQPFDFISIETTREKREAERTALENSVLLKLRLERKI